jgi:putative FmdB family regulatory protein
VPLYEYQCPTCGRFELIRKFSDEPLLSCPTCGAEVQKLLSAPAIQFKGTGWYITDYARKSPGGESGTSAKDGAGEGGKKDGTASGAAGSDKGAGAATSKDASSSSTPAAGSTTKDAASSGSSTKSS